MKQPVEVKPIGTVLQAGEDGYRILMKVYSACVYGDDLTAELPRVRPGQNSAHIAPLWCTSARDRMGKFDSGESIFSKHWCVWLMHRLLRAGAELIMEREQVFVRDLYPCYELFSKYYPEKEPQMGQVLEYALNPTNDLDEVRGLVDELCEFLEGETRNVFGVKQQQLQLPSMSLSA